MNRYYVFGLMLITLVGCSSAPKKYQLLPDGGVTSAEILEGSSIDSSYYPNFGNSQSYGLASKQLSPGYSPDSSYSNTHVEELRRDFKRLENPEIIGYVYPHINPGEMLVPGYYTTFLLYDKAHIILSDEGM